MALVTFYGKKTIISEFRKTKRGSKGVKALNVSEKNGYIASFKIYRPDTDLVIITNAGMVMRMSTDQISTLGRVTQGTRLMKLKDDSLVATVSLVDKEKNDINENVENIPVDNLENEEQVLPEAN